MENLNEALADLADTIREEGFRDGLVESIARDWDIKAPLLARMFESRHGKPASEWTAASKAAIRNARIECAMKRAIAKDANYHYPEGCPHILGKGFKNSKGEEFIAVNISTRGLIAIRICDGDCRIFGRGRNAFSLAEKFGLI